jgi:hypothetical protein
MASTFIRNVMLVWHTIFLAKLRRNFRRYCMNLDIPPYIARQEFIILTVKLIISWI